MEDRQIVQTPLPPQSPHIVQFEVSGLFGAQRQIILFPEQNETSSEPRIVILEGPNGCGKTTILRMISGILDLNFDIYRKMPFDEARISLDTGHFVHVKKRNDKKFPLLVNFGDVSAELSSNKQDAEYSADQDRAREALRRAALPILRQINFELLDIHRSFSLLLRKKTIDEGTHATLYEMIANQRTGKLLGRSATAETNALSHKVREFVQEAQVNYRKFFFAHELELLPRILHRLSSIKEKGTDQSELRNRIEKIRGSNELFARLGLETDNPDLQTLADLLKPESKFSDKASLAALEAYVENLESRNNTRNLIVNRLLEFENIMKSFLQNKSITIDSSGGLSIKTSNGDNLSESDLSSGEHHFLYMMVTALLCYRTGTIIAIDEPELSLHVLWQRKIIRALARCSSGASPLFLFATHSTAISAEYKDKVISLGPIE
jgi:energy-coupling factor transporter ATP-binding protein EcfA2